MLPGLSYPGYGFNQSPGISCLRLFINVIGNAHFFYLPFVHYNNPVAEIAHYAQVVTYKDNGKTKFFFKIVKEV